MGTGEQRQLRIAHRSTAAAVGGILLVVVALLLSATNVGGNVLPTVLAIVGVGSLMAGIATAALQVAGSFRYGRNAAPSDPVVPEDDDFRYRQDAPLHHLDKDEPA